MIQKKSKKNYTRKKEENFGDNEKNIFWLEKYFVGGEIFAKINDFGKIALKSGDVSDMNRNRLKTLV